MHTVLSALTLINAVVCLMLLFGPRRVAQTRRINQRTDGPRG
jgi:hypothetical protein